MQVFATIGSNGCCLFLRIFLCVLSSVHPFVIPTLNGFKYRPKIRWCDCTPGPQSKSFALAIFAHTTELWIFSYILRQGRMDDVTYEAYWGFQIKACYLLAWDTVSWSRSLMKMAKLDQFVIVTRNFEIPITALDQIWGRTFQLWTSKDLVGKSALPLGISIFKTTLLCPFYALNRTSRFSEIGLEQVWRNVTL